MATWTAQGAGDFGAFTDGKSTIWSSDGGTTWLGDGGADTFLLYNAAHKTDTFVGKTGTAISITNALSGTIWAAAINGAGTSTFTIAEDCTINADLTAGTAATFLINGGTPTVTIVGDITGGATSSDSCVAVSVAAVLTVTGDVTGGSASAAMGIDLSAAATVTINGNVTGGSNAGAYGVYSTSSTATLTVNGNVTASDGVAVLAASIMSVTVNGGNIIDTATVPAMYRANIKFNPGATNYCRIKTGTTPTTRDYYYDLPDASAVRETDTVAGVTGTVLTRTLSAANDTVAEGYYAATTLSAVDTDLAVGNIKSGTTIFGFAGEAAGGVGGVFVTKQSGIGV